MAEVLYKSSPKLFIISVTFLGAALFALLSWLAWSQYVIAKGKMALFFFLLFLAVSLVFFYLFITVKRVKLTADSLIISYFLLPFKNSFSFSEVKSVSQNSKKIEALVGSSRQMATIFVNVTTTFNFTDGRQIKLNSIGELDFDIFVVVFNKLKRKEGKVRKPKWDGILYLIDNFSGISWLILLVVLICGLSYALITK
ncbi:hypothetical protein [Mucilaginibacter sp. OK283]|jgi:hypothetical protein|uniref:hypothetical protein n=1 Tax=Mucilaginibacter sp. OK283 TaxID=1881049 RepID=UPI0008CF4723|nr:hypothetical protein [Mucilaginibacter sp. OK283]SEP45992.1 hypothetical protein SAMN05428947_12432 [Mucilaginibacter sp. OK283]